MGRVNYAAKNIMFGMAGNVATMVLRFVLRYVFIQQLGDTLLGVEGLYTDILTMLSLAELGVGTAINFSLYGLVARNEQEKIKSYMLFYKKAYRTIAAVIAASGLLLVPFLPLIVGDPGYISLSQLRIYYLIFLFNTVSSYFVAYKYSLANAEQKNYIQTNAITLTKIVTVALQTAALLVLPDFLLYLLIQAGVELAQKLFVNRYLDKKYPILKEKKVTPLSREERDEVGKKIRALVLHRVGDMARLQTDTLIISAFVGVTWVGLMGTYKMIVTSVSNYVNVIFNSVISGFGNLIATEGREKQFALFQVYRFFAIWVYGFSAVGFFLLLSPLVELYVGGERVLAASIVMWYLIDYFFKGERVVLSNFKTAAGVFEQDKFLTLIQGAVNLVISLALVRQLGIAGVYIGTVISGLIANITKPVIIYRVCFEKSAAGYFVESAKYLAVIGAALAILIPLEKLLMPQVTVMKFGLMLVVITVVFNGIFLLVFGRTAEFKYLYEMAVRRLRKR
ncbi:MAG: polysaccharide biosynthesis protein [Eubacteriales bacterium]|nr:polysaccharide biosynthesis protein [Eubacteriales bacterium]